MTTSFTICKGQNEGLSVPGFSYTMRSFKVRWSRDEASSFEILVNQSYDVQPSSDEMFYFHAS